MKELKQALKRSFEPAWNDLRRLSRWAEADKAAKELKDMLIALGLILLLCVLLLLAFKFILWPMLKWTVS